MLDGALEERIAPDSRQHDAAAVAGGEPRQSQAPGRPVRIVGKVEISARLFLVVPRARRIGQEGMPLDSPAAGRLLGKRALVIRQLGMTLGEGFDPRGGRSGFRQPLGEDGHGGRIDPAREMRAHRTHRAKPGADGFLEHGPEMLGVPGVARVADFGRGLG